MISKIFLFVPQLGGDVHFDDAIFQMGWLNHQLVLIWGGMSSILEYCDIPGSPTLLGAWSNPFTATTLVWRILIEVVCDPKLVSLEKERKALRKALTNRIYILQIILNCIWGDGMCTYWHSQCNKKVQELLAFRIKDRHAWRCVDGSW